MFSPIFVTIPPLPHPINSGGVIMTPKRLLPLFVLFASLALLVSACAPPPPPSAPAAEAPAAEAPAAEAPAEAEQVTLLWAFWGSPEEAKTHQMVADAFMAEHPNIKIETMVEPWGDYFTKIQALWAGGDPSVIPDVLFLWPTPRYAAEGVLENLQPWIEKTGYDLSDYWPALLESAMYNGDVYGLPRDIGLEVLYYNKDIFDEVGLEYPNDSWTWDDLVAAAEKLSIPGERYALAMEGGKYQLWVGQNYGSILDDMRNPSKCTLTEPAAMEGVKFFADLMDKGYAMRDADLSQAGGDTAVFLSGQAAMIIQNSSRVSAFNAAGMNYDVEVVPIPKGGQRSASAGGAAWVMSAASDNKEEAWTFLSWLQSTDGGQRLYTESGEIFPALQSTARSDAFLHQDKPPANRMAFLIEGENAKVGRFGYFPEWGELDGSIISPAMQRIWAGEASPEEVLPALCEQVDAFLAEHGYPK
ncbi:MAG: sugar ABC transporter substrate-binding protein [Caldilineae bacterium]|nr:MAG: sugar ABC transporter substrate-binding protein [Caldilineae bacterium]